LAASSVIRSIIDELALNDENTGSNTRLLRLKVLANTR
jgi:hypothetical protein